MITQKMKYALKALLVLADEAAKGQPEPLTIEEIANRAGTPKRFLEHILLEVRNAGVIASIRGRSGGWNWPPCLAFFPMAPRLTPLRFPPCPARSKCPRDRMAWASG